MSRILLIAALICLTCLSIRTQTAANPPATAVLSPNHGENASLQGTVTENPAKPKAAKANVGKRDLLENRMKRSVHKYQTPPGDTSRSREITVKAHAYCINGMTSRGVATRTGVIAVDPRVIPYGSKIYVPGYGWGTALDTGGDIVGNTIDIWMPTRGQCMNWGTKIVKIKVVMP